MFPLPIRAHEDTVCCPQTQSSDLSECHERDAQKQQAASAANESQWNTNTFLKAAASSLQDASGFTLQHKEGAKHFYSSTEKYLLGHLELCCNYDKRISRFWHNSIEMSSWLVHIPVFVFSCGHPGKTAMWHIAMSHDWATTNSNVTTVHRVLRKQQLVWVFFPFWDC